MSVKNLCWSLQGVLPLDCLLPIVGPCLHSPCSGRMLQYVLAVMPVTGGASPEMPIMGLISDERCFVVPGNRCVLGHLKLSSTAGPFEDLETSIHKLAAKWSMLTYEWRLRVVSGCLCWR